jgi:hypothetical protein
MVRITIHVRVNRQVLRVSFPVVAVEPQNFESRRSFPANTNSAPPSVGSWPARSRATCASRSNPYRMSTGSVHTKMRTPVGIIARLPERAASQSALRRRRTAGRRRSARLQDAPRTDRRQRTSAPGAPRRSSPARPRLAAISLLQVAPPSAQRSHARPRALRKHRRALAALLPTRHQPRPALGLSSHASTTTPDRLPRHLRGSPNGYSAPNGTRSRTPATRTSIKAAGAARAFTVIGTRRTSGTLAARPVLASRSRRSL